MGLETPVVLTVYGWPEATARVLERIALAEPRTLLVIADGPRPGDESRCAAAREVIESVSWRCEVVKNYAEVNMGPRLRISSGLNWAFDTVDEAIVLEHDCLPEASFFAFCSELLHRYRDDERVMHISGENYLDGRLPLSHSYFFSKYPLIWGWATWSRAWKHYDLEMKSWPAVRAANLDQSFFDTAIEWEYWEHTLQLMYDGKIDTWDYPWMFACFAQSGLSIHPAKNLVSYIGFTDDAVHTSGESSLASRATEPIGALSHPDFMIRNREADSIIFDVRYPGADIKASKTLWFRATQPARKIKHRIRMAIK